MNLDNEINLSIKKSNEFASKMSDEFKDIINNIKSKSSNNYIIDRFEKNFAICEDLKTGEVVNIKLKNISNIAKEGDLLKRAPNTDKFIIDITSTKSRKQLIENKVKNLWI